MAGKAYIWNIIWATRKPPAARVRRIRKHSGGLNGWGCSSNPAAVQRNIIAKCCRLAKKIRFEREQQGRESATGFRLVSRVKIDLLAWMREYYHHYTKRDVKVVKCAINAFMDFQTDPGRELLPRKEWTPEQREAALKTRRERAERLRLYPNQFTPVMAGSIC